ncbi:MAG: nucleotide exchange factor GrpE [Oscillospiraceae bacterium]
MAAKKKNEAAPEEEAKQETVPQQPAEEAGAEQEAAAPSPAADENKAAGELKAANDKYLRLMAEYDNFRKRSAKERENIYTDVRVDTVTRFLPVYDNLQRAMLTETADEAYKKGVEMTFAQLCEVFRKLGVEEIETEGKKFDPAYHNAVMHIEDEAYGESQIVEEFQKGFKIGDKVIRFSMVKVAN